MTSSVPTFLGALSFERRAVAAVLNWAHETIADGQIILFDYGGNATPGTEALEMREEVWAEIMENVPSRHSLERRGVNPYSMRDMADAIFEVRSAESLVVDLTCLTRPHVIAVAKALVLAMHPISWSVAYTSPKGYGSIGSPYPDYGWKDSLILPLGNDSSLDNQGLLLGILLLGFDVDRMAVAFDELEADAGVVVVSKTGLRPDFHRTAIAKSQVLTDHLRSLNLSGARGKIVADALGGRGWHFDELRMEDVAEQSQSVVRRVVSAGYSVRSAEIKPAPIVLYPFGPKLVVFCIAYELVNSYADFSWAVYPVPASHPTDYSTGIGRTVTLDSREFLS